MQKDRSMSREVYARTEYSKGKAAFLNSFTEDLRRIGMHTRVSIQNRVIHFRAHFRPLRDSALVRHMRSERLRRLQQEGEFIRGFEASGLGQLLADGRRLDVATIAPRLQICRTPEDFKLFRFCRLMESVPAPRLLYRQIAALVRDEGQGGSPLIGAFGLSSSIYTLGCRDRLFGWQRKENSTLKNKGLKLCMHLSVCISLPPYNLLRAGRLVAGLPCSSVVAAEFRRKYSLHGERAELLAVITTCATGLHGAIFNRLMVRPGGLYKRIGETVGYSTLFYSKETMATARRVVLDSDGLRRDPTDRAIRTFKRALDVCGIRRQPFLQLGIPKGVYIALAGPNALSALRGTQPVTSAEWPGVEDIVQHWKSKDVVKALADTARIGEVKGFRLGDKPLSKLLGGSASSD